MVVIITNDNYYKIHRILTPDGKAYEIPEIGNAESTPAGGVTENSSLATPINSAFNTSISETSENSNPESRFSADDDTKNKGSIANLTDENSPILTPETLVGTAPNASISETLENSNKEFDGIPLKSNYPGLTAYNRYLSSRNKETPEVRQDAVAILYTASVQKNKMKGRAPDGLYMPP